METQVNSGPDTLRWFFHSSHPLLVVFWAGFCTCLAPGRGGAGWVRGASGTITRALGRIKKARREQPESTAGTKPGDPGTGAAFTPNSSNSSIPHGIKNTQEGFFFSAFQCFLFWSQKKSNTRMRDQERRVLQIFSQRQYTRV